MHPNTSVIVQLMNAVSNLIFHCNNCDANRVFVTFRDGWEGGWLHTEINVQLGKMNPGTVTHPSTNRARRSLTSLIETNVLLILQTTTILSM